MTLQGYNQYNLENVAWGTFKVLLQSPACQMYLLIILINQIYHHFHHHIFLFGAAFGNHQREGDEGVVSYSFMPVQTIKYAILLHEPT